MNKFLSAVAALLFLSGTAHANDLHRCETGNAPQGEYVVYFDTGKTVIKPEGKEELKKAADRAKYMLDVCVVGQADNQGNQEFNKKLAMKRAKVVASELQRLGVPASTLVTMVQGEAFGDSLTKMLGTKKNTQSRRVSVRLMR